ncbi:MAG: AMP-binding protein [Acidimicrobiales bacterium]
MTDATPDVSFAARLDYLAEHSGDDPALSFGGTTLNYATLNRLASRLARHFLSLGAEQGDFVTIAEPNGVEFIASVLACWKIGAIPQPVSSRLPTLEFETIVQLADSALVVGAEITDRTCLPIGFQPSAELDDSPLSDSISPAWKAPTSGGSTGRPKLIVSGDPSVYSASIAGLGSLIGAKAGKAMAMPGPLYHNGPFIWSCSTLLAGGHLVLLQRFDAEETLRIVDRYNASAIYLVPTMMQRMWKLPDETKYSYDLSSLERAVHLAEPCPVWLKEAWIDWIGPENLWELYGGTEAQMFTFLSGLEWREHRGSVGRPIAGEVKVCDEDGNELEAGETGDVWMRWTGRDTPTYRYIGAEAEQRDGWECLGDIGWLDDDGYLYLADRRKDMILVGGANVYPAEIEAAINAHPLVESCAVIGLPDDDKGTRIHAIVQASGVEDSDLMAFLADRLVRYKLPRSIEWTDEPLRDDAGKVRRGALQSERSA